ncbi:hypothetical protein AKO1_008022 [Acrasis kona]|uniref:Metal-dependent carboxypeptidase n=1 Tax=Acrasis kona TaxID=1008807 RepID=A0AAW2YPS6_9EUKA
MIRTLFCLIVILFIVNCEQVIVDEHGIFELKNGTDNHKYHELTEILRKISILRGINAVLEWDQQVMMPTKGSGARAEHLAEISGILHERETDPKIGELLTSLESELHTLDAYEAANVKLTRKDYDRKTKLSKDLAEKRAKLSSEGFNTWVEARKTNNFEMFAPILTQWVALQKEIANLIDPSRDAYDVLLDDYEPGTSGQEIDNIFSQLKTELIPLVAAVRRSNSQVDDSTLLEQVYSTKTQEELSRKIASEVVGFDFSKGRLDSSAHPFSLGVDTDDVRITTRLRNNSLLSGLRCTVHEAGHALYEVNLNKKYKGQTVQRYIGVAIHESQSLFWERHILMGTHFWDKWYPHIKDLFGLKASKEIMFKSVNKVNFDNLIRVEADELTYPLHVILRFEIERELFNGTINVNELPKIWGERMEKYLGIKPSNDSNGVLQDVHWGSGYFGYFPTYTLGALYAAQIAAHPTISGWVRENDYNSIINWLRDNVHSKGSVTMTSEQLIKDATGEKLNPSYFINHLRSKYKSIYDLE